MRQPRGTRFSTIVRTLSSVSAVTRIRRSDGSSLVFPIVKRTTSNEALCRMTVSKMLFRMPESIRCPDASTTSEATGRSLQAFYSLGACRVRPAKPAATGLRPLPLVPDHDERQVVVLRGAAGKGVDVGQQIRDEGVGSEAAGAIDRGQQPIIHVLLARLVEGLGHAVAERDDEIAGLEDHGFLFERRVLEQAKHHASGLETAHS